MVSLGCILQVSGIDALAGTFQLALPSVDNAGTLRFGIRHLLMEPLSGIVLRSGRHRVLLPTISIQRVTCEHAIQTARGLATPVLHGLGKPKAQRSTELHAGSELGLEGPKLTAGATFIKEHLPGPAVKSYNLIGAVAQKARLSVFKSSKGPVAVKRFMAETISPEEPGADMVSSIVDVLLVSGDGRSMILELACYVFKAPESETPTPKSDRNIKLSVDWSDVVETHENIYIIGGHLVKFRATAQALTPSAARILAGIFPRATDLWHGGDRDHSCWSPMLLCCGCLRRYEDKSAFRSEADKIGRGAISRLPPSAVPFSRPDQTSTGKEAQTQGVEDAEEL